MSPLSRLAVLSFATLATALSACSERRERPTLQRQRETEIHQQVAQGQNREAAETAASIGELLFVPRQFKEADALFEKALKLDPGNVKANFYGGLSKVVLALEGFTKRFGPVLGERDTRAMANLEKDLFSAGRNYADLARHLTTLPAGEKPAADLAEVQAYARAKLIPALALAAERLSIAQKAGGLPLILGRRTWSRDASEIGGVNCVRPEGKWDCEVPSDKVDARVDSADLQVLVSVVKGYADYFRLLTAYDLTDAEKVAAAFEDASGLRDVVKMLRSYPNFGALSPDQELDILAGSLEDTLKTVIHLKEAESSLCQVADRKNSNVLLRSICVGLREFNFAERTLETLAGPTAVVLGKTSKGEPVTIRMNLGAFLRNPVKDLKSLLPKESQIDDAGNPRDVPDNTMGGLFPDGDFVAKAAQLRKIRVSLPRSAADAIREASRETRYRF